MASEDIDRPKLLNGGRQRLRCLLALGLAFPLLILCLAARGPEVHRRYAVARRAPFRAPLPVPPGVDLAHAARAVLLKGCGPASKSSGEGVSCRADLGVPELLSRPVESRFDPALANPCTERYCIPYFYILGAFHGGVRDLFARINAHDAAVFDYGAALRASPDKGPPRSPLFFSETHPWERMLWRGCDWGECPRRRGAGAEPIPLEQLSGLLQRANASSRPASAVGSSAVSGVGAGSGESAAGRGRVFGEAAPAAFSFTWSGTHSLLHEAWTASIAACVPPLRSDQRGEKQRCFLRARQAQMAWEARTLSPDALTSEGGGGGLAPALPLTVPWLMRAVHGTQRVRLIAVLREPASRLFSAFWFWPQYRRRYGHSADGFHAYAAEAVDAFNGCIEAVALVGRAVAEAEGAEARARHEPVGSRRRRLGDGPAAAELGGAAAASARPRAAGLSAGPSLSSGYTDELLSTLRSRFSQPAHEPHGSPHTPPAAARAAASTDAGAVGGRPAARLPERRVLEACATNFESLSRATQDSYYHADQLLRSLYAAFLPTWLDAFGESSLLLLRAEDYWARPREQLARVFAFLRVEPPSERAWDKVLGMPILRAHGSENATYWGDKAVVNFLVPRRAGLPGAPQTRMRVPMRADTAELLRAFFRPYNEEVARLARDERFTWRDVPLPTALAT